MISLISREWLRKQFQDMKNNSLESFLGTKATDLKIKAANNTEVDIYWIVTFNFCISKLNDNLKVPFIVTKQNLSTPIIGFNIIEHLVKTYADSDSTNPILNSVFLHLNSVKTEVLVNLVQEKESQSDFADTIRNFENFSIPRNSMTYLKCKIKTDNIGTKSLPFLFLTKLDLNTDLIITENLVRINPKRTKTIKIPVYNPTNKDTKLQRKILVR